MAKDWEYHVCLGGGRDTTARSHLCRACQQWPKQQDEDELPWGWQPDDGKNDDD